MKKSIIVLLAFVVIIAGIVVAQGFSLPNNFTVNPNWNFLPTPQPNQYIFGCRYELPMEMRNIVPYGWSINGTTLNLDISFSLYSGNKRGACSVERQIVSINLLNWQQNLENWITTESSNNIATSNTPSPIGVGSGS